MGALRAEHKPIVTNPAVRGTMSTCRYVEWDTVTNISRHKPNSVLQLLNTHLRSSLQLIIWKWICKLPWIFAWYKWVDPAGTYESKSADNSRNLQELSYVDNLTLLIWERVLCRLFIQELPGAPTRKAHPYVHFRDSRDATDSPNIQLQ